MYSLYIFVLAKLLSVQYLCPRSFLRETPYETQATRDRWVETGSLEWWLNLHPSAMCELHLCAQGGGHSKLHMHRGGTFRITCSVNNTFCHAMPNNKYSGTHTQTFLFWRPRDEIMVNPLHISKKKHFKLKLQNGQFFRWVHCTNFTIAAKPVSSLVSSVGRWWRGAIPEVSEGAGTPNLGATTWGFFDTICIIIM